MTFETITEEDITKWLSYGYSDYMLSRLTTILNGTYSLDEAREDVLSFRNVED
jgi:hypothetical protein